MSSLRATIQLDVRLQARSQLYAIGIAVAVLVGLAGRFWIHPDYAGRVLAVIYLSGIGSSTYMIGASFVLLEKNAGTLHALRATPLTATAYITSKVFTLTSFALLESTIVYVVAVFGTPLHAAPMLTGVAVLGSIYTLVGLGQVAPHDSVTAFLFPGAVLINLVMELPMFYVITGPATFWYLIPTHAPFLLMLGATQPLTAWQWTYAIVVSIALLVITFWWAQRRLTRLLGLQGA